MGSQETAVPQNTEGDGGRSPISQTDNTKIVYFPHRKIGEVMG